MTLSPSPRPIRRCRSHPSLTFQTPTAITDIYKGSFFPRTIRDWNALPNSIIPQLKVQRTVLLGLPLWWELGTNFPYHRSWCMYVIRRITSKKIWFWSKPFWDGYNQMGHVKRKVILNMRNMRRFTEIILRMRKVSSGPLRSIDTFCSIQWFC